MYDSFSFTCGQGTGVDGRSFLVALRNRDMDLREEFRKMQVYKN